MFCRKKVPRLTEEIERDPNKYSAWVIESVGEKAKRYKKWSRRYSILSVLLSSLVVFVLMFEGVSTFTVIASSITILNSLLLAWFQLEKPYERWRLYRKYHRLFEAERVKFINGIAPYNSSNSKSVLVENVSNLQLLLHYEWEGLVPSTDDLNKLQKGR